MSKRLIIALSLIVLAPVVLLVPNFMRPRVTTARAACINNLRQIGAAKQQWALEYSKTTNDFPTLADLQPYMGRGTAGQIPVCPSGGFYTPGRVGAPPTCTIGGPSHTLP